LADGLRTCNHGLQRRGGDGLYDEALNQLGVNLLEAVRLALSRAPRERRKPDADATRQRALWNAAAAGVTAARTTAI
jgi:hypothetical protein